MLRLGSEANREVCYTTAVMCGAYEYTRDPQEIFEHFDIANRLPHLKERFNIRPGQEIKSYTIITTRPNKTVAAIHPRMPVILKREDENTWINPDLVEPEQLLPLLVPYPDREMESYPVSRLINSPRNDTKEVLKPLQIKEQTLF